MSCASHRLAATAVLVTTWGIGLMTMACWSPLGNDQGVSASCLTMPGVVQTCEAAAALTPASDASQTFYDCLDAHQ
jgi:hypothetical protein